MVGYISMALNPSNSSNLEQLELKGLMFLASCWTVVHVNAKYRLLGRRR